MTSSNDFTNYLWNSLLDISQKECGSYVFVQTAALAFLALDIKEAT